MTLELYHAMYSTCSQKVRLCLFEKNLDWIDNRVDLFNKQHLTPEYKKLNPNGVVPTLVHDGKPVIESSVIVEYLDDVFPEPPLSPESAYGKAQLRAWICFINEVPTAFIRYPTFNLWVPAITQGLSDAEIAENAEMRGTRKYLYRKVGREGLDDSEMIAALDALRQTVVKVDDALADHPWIAGDFFSLAECTIIPSIDRMEDLGMEEMWADKERFAGWWDRIKSRDCYRQTYPKEARLSTYIPDLRQQSQAIIAALCERTGRPGMAQTPH